MRGVTDTSYNATEDAAAGKRIMIENREYKKQPTELKQDTTKGGEDTREMIEREEIVGELMGIIKKAIDTDYRKEDIDEKLRKNSVSSYEDSRNESLDEACDENNEDMQKHTCQGELQPNLPVDKKNDKSRRSVVTKQQAETKSKEERTMVASPPIRF